MRVTPRTANSVIHFITEFEKIVREWPADTKTTLPEIANRTKTELPYVVSYLSDILGNSFDIFEPISYREAQKALTILKQKTQHELEESKRRLEFLRTKTEEAYEKLKEKVCQHITAKNWHSAYRTLSYFYGINETHLSNEVAIDICSECLRLGIKSRVNLQELGRWLEKGVEKSLQNNASHGIEDAIDFLDAYKDYFINEAAEKGRNLYNNLLCKLQNIRINSCITQSDVGAVYSNPVHEGFEGNKAEI